MTKLSHGSHLAALNDFQLHYSVIGEGPPLVVTSPGWGIGMAPYFEFAPLGKEFTLILLDTRGSGKSTRPADPTQMGSATMADDIEELRQYLELDSIDVMGHSNGGAIALAYAARHRTNLRKLVLIDSQLIGFSGKEATEKFVQAGANDPRYQAAVPHVGLPLPDTDEECTQYVRRLLPLFFHDPEKNLPLFEPSVKGPISAWASRTQGAADRLPSAVQTSILGDIRAKSLILVGRYDWICPVIVSERIHAGIRDSELVVFEQSGHMPWIEEPERFFAEIRRFLGK